jgi:hypothetical protein
MNLNDPFKFVTTILELLEVIFAAWDAKFNKLSINNPKEGECVENFLGT